MLLRAIVHRNTEKGQKQQNFNGTENILLRDCATTGVRNYDQKSYGRSDIGAARNSLRSGKFSACHVSSRQTSFFNHDQVTRTTPQLAPPSSNFPVTPSLFKKGISYREIAKIVGRSHSCVQKIIGRFKSDGLIENKSGRGRKSILSDVAKRKVLKDIKIDPKLSIVKLAAETSRIISRCVSAETVRNLIRHARYSSRVARKKPFIILQNQEKHLEFTKTHQLKTDNFWKKVIFSDESKFNFLEVMAVAPFGESRTPFWIQKIYVLQLNMVVVPGVVWLQMR
ncbi:HTH_Tnp_Tc3_2 domain-containing protein [Trichonephila clavipes]|uniref:HTH_Tnp_Tc3_2 domain-containing protein n=1 Tax=Trichonephila clavipes TaxID=2585209 RepID=A0A8X6V490_TRICX|nr:HTH_Tnp_Tc3_2 domain-containing protein [Trichonephila clavipes]